MPPSRGAALPAEGGDIEHGRLWSAARRNWLDGPTGDVLLGASSEPRTYSLSVHNRAFTFAGFSLGRSPEERVATPLRHPKIEREPSEGGKDDGHGSTGAGRGGLRRPEA